MSLLGKIFTGIILVTSIIVMVIGMAVYSTHTNWRDAYQALNTKLNQAESDYTDQKAAYLRQISQLEAEKEANEKRIAAAAPVEEVVEEVAEETAEVAAEEAPVEETAEAPAAEEAAKEEE